MRAVPRCSVEAAAQSPAFTIRFAPRRPSMRLPRRTSARRDVLLRCSRPRPLRRGSRVRARIVLRRYRAIRSRRMVAPPRSVCAHRPSVRDDGVRSHAARSRHVRWARSDRSADHMAPRGRRIDGTGDARSADGAIRSELDVRRRRRLPDSRRRRRLQLGSSGLRRDLDLRSRLIGWRRSARRGPSSPPPDRGPTAGSLPPTWALAGRLEAPKAVAGRAGPTCRDPERRPPSGGAHEDSGRLFHAGRRPRPRTQE
jgi:hypothetical protein